MAKVESSRWVAVPVSCFQTTNPDHPFRSGEQASRLLAWLDLVAMAWWKDSENMKRGEFRVSVRFLARRWNWSKSRVGRFLARLEREGRIEKAGHSPGQQAVHFSICHYDTYKGPRDTERDSERTKEVPRKRSTKEEKHIAEVFGYWRDCRKGVLGLNGRGPRMTLSEKRASAVRARLREGYTTEHLHEAIDGCLGSRRNVEGGHIDLELICRDQPHVEQYRAWHQRDMKSRTDPRGPTVADTRAAVDAAEVAR